MIDGLLKANSLEGVRTKAFPNASAAEKYFAIKNVIPEGKTHYANYSFYDSILCDDLRAYKANNSIKCDLDLRDSYAQVLSTTYNLTTLEQHIDPTQDARYQDNILFHINFFEAEE